METKKLYEIISSYQHSYHDFFGYINSKPQIYFTATTYGKNPQTGATIKNGTEQFTSFENIYIKVEEKYEKVQVKDLYESKSLKLYTSPRSPYSYSYQSISDYNAIEVKPMEFSIQIGDKSLHIGDFKGLKQILGNDVYILPKDYVEKPLYNYEVKEGDYVISTSEKRRCKQTFLVKEVYHQPNENYLLCKLYSEYDGYEFDASCAWGIWQLPYKKYPERANELAQFNDEIRERELNPLWEFGSYTMTAGVGHSTHTSNHATSSGNLYWQKMEDAASYTISLYKYYPNNDVEKKLFLLEEFEVDRNKHWLTINNLFGNNYIIRIKAEDRSGGILAVSRGIKIKWTNTTNEQKPEFWK